MRRRPPQCVLVPVLMLLFAATASNAQAEGSWVDFRQVGRFYVFSEFRIDRLQVVDAFIGSLKEHEADVLSTLDLPRSARPILIELFADRRNYRARVAQLAPDAVRRQAAFIRADSSATSVGRVCVYLHSGVGDDLRHEVTHAILHSSLPFLPLWLDEGLAEYFEVPAKERASGHGHQRSVQRSVRLPLGRISSLERLEEQDKLSSISERDYRDAWAWTHFLLHGPPDCRRLMSEYLKLIEAHEPPGPLSARLRELHPNPRARLTSHFESWK